MSVFEPSNLLRKALSASPHKQSEIVGALMGYINADPKFLTKDFEDAIRFVLENGIKENELYVEFDSNLKYDENIQNWTEKYYALARVYLKENFCKKRIDHVKKIARKLYPVQNMVSEPQVKLSEHSELRGEQTKGKKYQGQQTKENPSSRKIILLIVAVVVVLVAITLSILV